MDSLNYALDFSQFVALQPNDSQLAEWNYRRMLMSIRKGDPMNAGLYAIELTRWSLAHSGYRLENLKMDKPRYQHDCKECSYLGEYNEYDLYYCAQDGLPSVIARYGNDGPEYTSGINSDHPALAEARARYQDAAFDA